MSPHPFVVLAEDSGSIRARLLKQRLDDDNAHLIARRLGEAVGGAGGRRLELDLSEVTFVSGSGLGSLVGLKNALKASGSSLTLLNVDEKVFGVIEAARLNAVLDVRPAERRAI